MCVFVLRLDLTHSQLWGCLLRPLPGARTNRAHPAPSERGAGPRQSARAEVCVCVWWGGNARALVFSRRLSLPGGVSAPGGKEGGRKEGRGRRGTARAASRAAFQLLLFSVCARAEGGESLRQEERKTGRKDRQESERRSRSHNSNSGSFVKPLRSWGVFVLWASALTDAHDGALEAVCSLAHPMPGVAGQSPGDLGHGAGVRPGPDPSRWSPALPAAQQLAPSRPQSQGDQPETSDVPGKVMRTSR